MRTISLSLVFVVAFTAGFVNGCGGGGGVKPTPKCVLNSDCEKVAPGQMLVCALGFCVSKCNESVDCPSGQLCVKSDNGNACRAPELATNKCTKNSECDPLVCGRDLTCRTECATDIDCLKGQKCTVSLSCADPKIDKNYDPVTNDFMAPPDAGTSTGTAGTGAGTAGAGAAGTGAGTAGSGAGTAGATGTAGTGADGGAGATGAAGTGTDGGTNPDVPAAVPSGIVVTPGDKLRQGQSTGITITITQTAGGLSNASIVDFGDLKGTVQPTSTDTSLAIRVTVPHGALLGKRTLKVSTKSGLVTATDVVEVTAITAAPTGDDTAAGTSVAPYRSLKQAIAVSDVGDTIHLVDGKYSAQPVASGGSAETWGYTLPTDLTIVGDTTAGAIIDGVGVTSADGFDVAQKLTLKNLTIQNFRYGIDINKAASTVTVTDVIISNNTNHAIIVEQAAAGSSLSILGAKTSFTQTSYPAVSIANVQNVTVTVTDATLQAGGDVIQFSSNVSGGKLTVTNAIIKALTTNASIYLYYVSSNAVGTMVNITNSTLTGTVNSSDAKGTINITGGTIADNAGYGIYFDGSILNVTGTKIMLTGTSGTAVYVASPIGSVATLKNVAISGNGYGINQTGAGSLVKLRGTTVQTTYHAYQLSSGDLDMGTATESGDNWIAQPTTNGHYCLYIGRSVGTATPITSANTAIGANGAVPAMQTIDATAVAVNNAYRWYLGVGNKLAFYTP